MVINKYGLFLKTVTEEDAGFILQLRTDIALSTHLSPTNNSIEEQIHWIKKYKEREKESKEYYFVAYQDLKNPLGLNRLYNFTKDTFEIGSWLYKPQADPSIPILGDLAARDFGFETFDFEFCTFNVRKENKKVLRYHKQFNPEVLQEDNENYYFRLSWGNYKEQRDKLLNILL